MKSCKGSMGMAPAILDPDSGWTWVVGSTPRPIYLWERTPVRACYEGGWAAEPFGRFGEE